MRNLIRRIERNGGISGMPVAEEIGIHRSALIGKSPLHAMLFEAETYVAWAMAKVARAREMLDEDAKSDSPRYPHDSKDLTLKMLTGAIRNLASGHHGIYGGVRVMEKFDDEGR